MNDFSITPLYCTVSLLTSDLALDWPDLGVLDSDSWADLDGRYSGMVDLCTTLWTVVYMGKICFLKFFKWPHCSNAYNLFKYDINITSL